jgi:hypothetical protein
MGEIVSVEILSVSLSDDSIEKLAQRLHQLVTSGGSVTQSNPPSSQNPQPAEQAGFQQPADPWADQAPAPQQQQQWPSQQPQQQQYQQQGPPPAVQQGPPERYCPHGKMRFVPAGTSAQGKPYGAFYGCPLERGNPNQCRSQRVNG